MRKWYNGTDADPLPLDCILHNKNIDIYVSWSNWMMNNVIEKQTMTPADRLSAVEFLKTRTVK